MKIPDDCLEGQMIGIKFVCHTHLGVPGWLVLYNHSAACKT